MHFLLIIKTDKFSRNHTKSQHSDVTNNQHLSRNINSNHWYGRLNAIHLVHSLIRQMWSDVIIMTCMGNTTWLRYYYEWKKYNTLARSYCELMVEIHFARKKKKTHNPINMNPSKYTKKKMQEKNQQTNTTSNWNHITYFLYFLFHMKLVWAVIMRRFVVYKSH